MFLSAVHEVSGHNLAMERESAFYLDDGTQVELASHLATSLPMGKTLWLQVEDGEVRSYLPSPDTEAAPIERRELKVALLRCVPEARLNDEDFLREELRKASTAAATVQNFWRSKGWRFVQFEVRPFLLPMQKGEALPDKSQWCKPAIARLFESNPEFKEYDPSYFHLWGNRSLSYCGWGQRPGRYSMSFSSCGPRTMCHEVGHNFGLQHSNSVDNLNTEDESEAEYGNGGCVMGRGWSLSAAQTLKLPLNTEREWFTLNKSRRFLMAPLEGNEYDLHPGMYQAVKFSRGSRNYVIGYMRTKNNYALTVERDVGKPAIIQRAYKPGSTIEIEDVTITLEDNRGGYALVNVDFGDGLGNQGVSLPEDLPVAVAPNEPGPEHTGVWWNALLDGQGFDLRDNQLNWYTYNPRRYSYQTKTSQRWFKGELEGNLVTLYTGNEESDGLVECGSGRLSFVDDNHGVFQYYVEDEAFPEKVRRGSVWIERVMPSLPNTGNLAIYSTGTWKSTHYLGPTSVVTFSAGFGPRPTDHIGRTIKGRGLNQVWRLEVNGRVVRPHNGLFMEQILPEYEED